MPGASSSGWPRACAGAGPRRRRTAPAAPTFTKEALGISAEDPDAFLKGAMLVGSPDTIAAKLEECMASGVPHIKLCFNYGYMTREEADRQLNLFLGSVYPRFKEKPRRPHGGRLRRRVVRQETRCPHPRPALPTPAVIVGPLASLCDAALRAVGKGFVGAARRRALLPARALVGRGRSARAAVGHDRAGRDGAPDPQSGIPYRGARDAVAGPCRSGGRLPGRDSARPADRDLPHRRPHVAAA